MKILKNGEWVTVYPVVTTDKLDFTGATASVAGTSGSVPAPAAGKQGAFLKGNGSWSNIDYSDIVNTPVIPEGATLDSELSTTSNNAVQNKVVTAALNSKVGTSSANTFTADNYFTGTTYINGATGLYLYASNNPNRVVATLTANGYSGTAAMATKATQDFDGNVISTTYAKTSDLAAVATSGSYNDLSDKPTILDVSGYAKTAENNSWSGTQTFYNPINFYSGSVYITWLDKNGGMLTSANYTGTAAKATADADGNTISSTYAKKASLATVATSGSYNDLSNKPTIPSAITVDAALNSTSTNPVQNKAISIALDKKVNTSSLATVATSGSYNDLSDKPTIPDTSSFAKTTDILVTVGDYTTMTGRENLVVIDPDEDIDGYYSEVDTLKSYAEKAAESATKAEAAAEAVADTQTLVDMFYPVGSVYMTTSDTLPTFMSYGTWEEIAADRVLQGASSSHSAGSTIEAGLPNITGHVNANFPWCEATQNGALKTTEVTSSTVAGSASQTWCNCLYFDASDSNSIYGSSTTVQPPAYVVHIYRRTA